MADQLTLVYRDMKPEMPRGFVAGSLPGTIAPTSGQHAGVPMLPESELVRAILRARADG